MQKIKVGIVGYGNLGKGVESAIKNSQWFELVRIFSKREGLTSPFGTQFDLTKNLDKYAKKIDVLFLCGGSFSDIETIGPETIKKFNTVDSFDTHAKLESYITKLDNVAKENEHVAVSAGGWDPGLMSMIRTYPNHTVVIMCPQNQLSQMFIYGGIDTTNYADE